MKYRRSVSAYYFKLHIRYTPTLRSVGMTDLPAGMTERKVATWVAQVLYIERHSIEVIPTEV